MSNDVLTLGPQDIRGTDSNSLLRLYDRAHEIRNKSPLQLERTKADKVIRRLAQELQKRKVPLTTRPESSLPSNVFRVENASLLLAPRAGDQEDAPMLSSYPVACPHDNCGWTGSLVPARIRGGAGAEIASRQRAWFRCPRCQRDWEVRITEDRVTVLPVVEHGS